MSMEPVRVDTTKKKSRSMLNIQLRSPDDLELKHWLETEALRLQQEAERAGSGERVDVSSLTLQIIREARVRMGNGSAKKK